jgi:pimeloyl-ACP methyl ester carboxylesterase
VPRTWESLLVAERGTESSAGPPVLLVHGQPGTGADWDELLPRLGGRRVLVVDRPGYGRSALGPTSMAENAGLLAELLVGRSAAPAVVVGHSYGGGVGVLMAARRPDVVGGLVLLGSVGPRSSVDGLDRLLASPWLGDALSAAGLATIRHVLPRLRRVAGRLPAQAGARLRAVLPDGRDGVGAPGGGVRLWRSFVAEQRWLLAEIADVERSLAQVRVPTAVVSGTWDRVVAPAVAAQTAAAIAGSELVVLSGVSHFPARDAPARVERALRRVEARMRVG